MAKRNKLAVRFLGATIVMAMAAGVAWRFLLIDDPVEVTAIRVERGRVEQTVTAIASGTVIPRQESMLAAEIMGVVSEIHFEEGDSVQPGDTLLELHHGELDAQVALAEANLRAGESRLAQARLAEKIYAEIAETNVSQTSAQLEQARSDFQRAEALERKNAISKSDYDKGLLALRVAEETHAAAVASQKETLVRREEVRSAESMLEQLGAAVSVAKATRDKAVIKAPFSGTVARKFVDVGEAVNIGLPVAHLVHNNECYVEAPFDEANAADIALGQKARLNLDAYRGTDFPGVIYYITPIVSSNQDFTRTVNAKIRVEKQMEKFIGGMSVDVVVLVDEKDDVVFAPSEALIREQYAYVVENGRAVKREVRTGVGNWQTTEILDGLNEGDLLITSVGLKELTDGARVKVTEKAAEE